MTTYQTTLRSPRTERLGLAVLRVAVGLVFVMHGAQKIFQYGLEGTSAAFGEMGVPLGAVAGPLVAFVELLGGLALVLGLGARIAAVPLSAVMLGAFVMVHLPNGFFLPGGFEFVMVLLAGNVAIALNGPGAFALDNLLARRTETPAAPAGGRKARLAA